jgi:hypothetical protein
MPVVPPSVQLMVVTSPPVGADAAKAERKKIPPPINDIHMKTATDKHNNFLILFTLNPQPFFNIESSCEIQRSFFKNLRITLPIRSSRSEPVV